MKHILSIAFKKANRFIRRYNDWLLFATIIASFLFYAKKHIFPNGFFCVDLAFTSAFLAACFGWNSYVKSNRNNQGEPFSQIIIMNGKYYIEISNVGNSPIYDVQLNMQINSNTEQKAYTPAIFEKFRERSFNLKQGDTRYILLDNIIDKSDVVVIKGNYLTKGTIYNYDNTMSIEDLDLWSL